jgi:hypothetical protein
MPLSTQTGTRSLGHFIGHLARSFIGAMGEFAVRFDALSLEDKQPAKEALLEILSASGRYSASVRLLTKDDEEMRRILSDRGWWVLQRDINGPVKRELLRLGREGKADQIDSYLCALFNENDAAQLRAKVESWLELPYLADRKRVIIDSLEAHKAGKWTLSIPALLPLVDGIVRRFRKEHLRPSKNPGRVIQVRKFAEYYRKKQPKLFGGSFARFMHTHMYAKFDFDSGAPPSSINRHGILHGEIRDYATQANSLRVFLLLDTIAQFIRAFERRRKTPPKVKT